MFVVVVGVLIDDEAQVPLSDDQNAVGGLAPAGSHQRSATAFIRGAPGRMGTTRTPVAEKTASKPSVK
ncbi:hypothetical protein [Streptomyces sp. 8N616]|uniref:hypothetical protein n=1 Tax=Streptomyces sp. 8N616 TaxID=3457414 RepID=UPI003FD42523